MIAVVSPNFDCNHDIETYLNQFSENLPNDKYVKYLLTSETSICRKEYENTEFISIPFRADNGSGLSKLFWALKMRKILIQLYRQSKIEYVNLDDTGLMVNLLLPKCVPIISTASSSTL